MPRVMLQAPVPVSQLHGVTHEEAIAQYDALVKQLRSLDIPDWDKPTDCPPWTVKDIAAHLLGWMEVALSFGEFKKQTSDGIKYRKEYGDIVDAYNHGQVESRKDLSGPEVLQRIEAVGPKILKLRKRLGTVGRFLPMYFPGFGFVNVRYMITTIFPRDSFMHRVDIARATGRELELIPSDQRLIADVVADWVKRTGADVRVELSGTAGGNYIAGSASAVVRGDAVEFARVMTGRAAPESLEIEGDRAAAVGWLRRGCPF